jgi:translation initiation factor IF-2
MNSSKVRIYELSRELNLDNKDILAVCDQLNIAVKSHSSTITGPEAERIRTAAEKYVSSPPSSPTPPQRREQISSRGTAFVPQSPQLNKPKKQQILEIRKHNIGSETFTEPPVSRSSTTSDGEYLPRTLTPPARSAPKTTEEIPPSSARPTPPPQAVTPSRKAPESFEKMAPKAEVAKPRLELAGPPTKPVSASKDEVEPSLIKKPILKRAKSGQAEEVGSADQSVSFKQDFDPEAPPRRQALPELHRPQLVRPSTAPDLVRRGSDRSSYAPESESSAPIKSEPVGLLLDDPGANRLAPIRPKRAKSKQEEEDDLLELQGKSGKAGTKLKRKPQLKIEEDEEEVLGAGFNAQAVVDVSQSLVRPLKPKSAKQTKPAAIATTRITSQKSGRRSSRGRDRRQQEEVIERPEKLILTGDLTVQELASELAIPETEVIKTLFFKGIAANINQTLDVETATMVAQALDFEVETAERESIARKVTEMLDAGDLENLQRRPPVVTIMGHVDHGKTTLLDSIRATKVAQGEAGGITQHIGAYHVDIEHEGQMQQVVFLDTPGHEAFTAMRARGTRVTDIAVLVVAADDGVRPQTVEAISHARAAEVPIVVAINKIDKEGAQPERVKQELTEYQLVSEEWGGDTIMVPVSAINGENLDTLLEMILLVAEVEDLYANPNRTAKGTVIEAHLDKAKGPVASLLVQNGTLRIGDTLVAGSAFGKVRAMVDDRAHRVEAAGPSFAVEVLGLGDVPAAGDEFEVFRDEKEARAIAGDRAAQQRQSRLQQAMASRRVSLNVLSDQAREGELKELNLILKADVQGSVEAILGALGQLPQNEVQVRVLFAAPGEISETDVDLATASNAVIIGFNTTLASGARQAADQAEVDIRDYNIIYKLLEDIQGAMEGLLEPELVEEALGQAEVRAVFAVGRGAVAGCYVQSGKLVRNCKIRVHRGDKVVHEGNLDSLKRMKEDVREVNAGYECGIGLDNFQTWAEGDSIEAFRMVTKRRTLSAS